MSRAPVLKEFEATFLKDYWQKKPLLIRGALPGGWSAVSPEELAGLACQDGVESRIVVEKGEYPWQTYHGPFNAKFFQKLPRSHWTLLVQAVDRLVPDVSELLQRFRFLPNWRLDDIMISYAVDQGSVGPHTDNYDVFLIQAKGRRRWEVGGTALVDPPFKPGLDLKILETFEASESYLLEAGDMLYLPPGFAHSGVADGECLTYSVGFRAPTQVELLSSFAMFLQQNDAKEHFYTDAALENRAADPGRVEDHELERLRQLMIAGLSDETQFRRWIGGFLTEPRSYHQTSTVSLPIAQVLKDEEQLYRIEGGRFAYSVHERSVYFAVEGETMVLPRAAEGFVQWLCLETLWPSRHLQQAIAQIPEAEAILQRLWDEGYVRGEDTGDEEE